MIAANVNKDSEWFCFSFFWKKVDVIFSSFFIVIATSGHMSKGVTNLFVYGICTRVFLHIVLVQVCIT